MNVTETGLRLIDEPVVEDVEYTVVVAGVVETAVFSASEYNESTDGVHGIDLELDNDDDVLEVVFKDDDVL